MKLLYTHENKIIVENARNCLRSVGIEPVIRNEFAAGGMGELSPIQTWPELWVDEASFSQATKVIEKLFGESDGSVWSCQRCGEQNEPAFEICWQCQGENA